MVGGLAVTGLVILDRKVVLLLPAQKRKPADFKEIATEGIVSGQLGRIDVKALVLRIQGIFDRRQFRLNFNFLEIFIHGNNYTRCVKRRQKPGCNRK